MSPKLRYIIYGVLSCYLATPGACYPIPPGPNVICAEEQTVEIPWEVQMQDLIFYLESQLVDLRHKASYNFISAVDALKRKTRKLQRNLTEYMSLTENKRTLEFRKDVAGQYCNIINELASLREKIEPPSRAWQKET